MLEQIQKLKEVIGAKRELLLSVAELPPDSPEPKICLDNTGLLLDTLESFTKEEKAKYLPKTIEKDVEAEISKTISGLESIDGQPASGTISSVLLQMDLLYAICLEYGLITFGFSSKEALSMVEQIKAYKNEVAQLANESRKAINQKAKTVGQLAEKADGNIQVIQQSLTQLVQTKMDEYKEKIELQVGEAEKTVKTIKEFSETAKSLQAEINKGKEEVVLEKEGLVKLLAEVTKTKESISSELLQIQKEHQISTQTSTTVSTLTAQIQVKLDDSTKSLVNIQNKETQVTDFYKNIEIYKAEIIKFQKGVNEQHAILLEQTEGNIKNFTDKTKNIIEQNEAQQNKITELLAKAVGTSLFTAQSQRTKKLFRSRLLWLIILVLTVIGACIFVLYLAYASKTPDMTFFIRLSLVGPLAFWVWFATAQYGKERHSEEEYAFKSTISISLDPYRDLLKKMREDGAKETEFVQKLMEEIFDNPVRHIYKDHSESKELLERKYEIVEIIKEISSIIDKIQSMEDFVSGKSQLINLLEEFCRTLRPNKTKMIAGKPK
jgi:DNA repair exonuclease SbcCD ATPase subunit